MADYDNSRHIFENCHSLNPMCLLAFQPIIWQYGNSFHKKIFHARVNLRLILLQIYTYPRLLHKIFYSANHLLMSWIISWRVGSGKVRMRVL